MLHRFAELALPLSGFSSGFAFLFSQSGDSFEKWGTMGAVVVISCLLAFIITQRDPKAQEKHAELIKNLTDKYTTTIDNLEREHAATVKAIIERNSAASEKSQQEYVIAMQGMVKDTKELVDSVVGKLIGEQREQRKDLMAWTRNADFFESDDDKKSRASGNDKGIGS